MSHEWRQATNSRKPHTYFRNTVTPSSQISQHRSVFDLRFDVLGTWIRSDCALLGPREFKRTHLSSQQEKTTSTLSNAFVIDVSCDCSSDLWTWWAQRVMLGALNMTACGHCNQILGGFRISSAAITWGPIWSFTGGWERGKAISNHGLVVSMQRWQSTKISCKAFKTRIFLSSIFVQQTLNKLYMHLISVYHVCINQDNIF